VTVMRRIPQVGLAILQQYSEAAFVSLRLPVNYQDSQPMLVHWWLPATHYWPGWVMQLQLDPWLKVRCWVLDMATV